MARVRTKAAAASSFDEDTSACKSAAVLAA